MPEWVQNLIMTALGSTTLAGGIGWWFKTRREDRNKEDARTEATRAALETRVEKLNDKVESLLRDAIAREREVITQNRDRMEIDQNQKAVIAAATTALKEATVLMARLKGTS